MLVYIPLVLKMYIKLILFQSLLQAHDVLSSEVYGEDAIRVTPPPVAPYANGGQGMETEIGPEAKAITRVRLVQFQKNTDEPMVKYFFNEQQI